MATQLRAFVELPRPELGAEVTLSDSDSRHATSSLRLAPGSEIILVDKSSGRTFKAKITAIDKAVKAKITEELPQSTQKESKLSGIIFGLSKGEKNDFVVEKATELGASHIILMQTERSVLRIDGPEAAHKKLQRWEKIAESAAQQSKRNSVPTVSLAVSKEELCQAFKNLILDSENKFICSLEPEARGISEFTVKTGAWVAVGPEGDFSPVEYSLLKSLGFQPITLGQNVLRAETAAIVAMALVYGAGRF